MTTVQILGQQLRLLRNRAGMSQEDVAALKVLSKKTLNNVENGKHAPNWDTLERLAKTYKVTIGDIFTPWAQPPQEAATDIYIQKVRAILKSRLAESFKTSVDLYYNALK